MKPARIPTVDRTDVGNLAADRAPRAWPRFMTARVAADYCDSSPWTIRRNVKPCGRRGRSFVYTIESVEAWMRGKAIEQPQRSATPAIDHSQPTPQAVSLTRIRELGRARCDRDRRKSLASDPSSVAA